MGPPVQLDLFAHSRDTMLRNNGHGALPALGALVNALVAATDTAPFTHHADAAQARAQLREAGTGQNSLPEQAFRLMAGLLGLARQGRHRELIDGRKRLRDLRPGLYAADMTAR